jgi:hypothetical protein
VLEAIMSVSKLRAWWWYRQGLDGSLQGRPAADVLDRTGWARSVGGVGPYLTLFSRAGIRRSAADAAVAALEIHELPCARGCTYVVPASDFALALKVGHGFNGDMATARKMGVTDKEIDRLCRKIIAALAESPLEPEEMRAAAGDAVRSLGEDGKKRGLTTTLPLAVGRLQAEGEIRRIPVSGRLDQQRYRYALWRPNPLATARLSVEEAHVEIARRFFRWISPATAAEFQAFSGLGAKAARAALDPLGLVALSGDAERLMLPEDCDAYERVKPAETPQYALVSSLDGLALLRRDLALLLDPVDAKRKTQGGRVSGIGGLADLPNHAIFDRGRLVGLWEYNQDAQSIAWWSFVKKDKALKEAVARVEAFVRDDLGDARSFSLDSPKSRAPRIAALRRAASA